MNAETPPIEPPEPLLRLPDRGERRVPVGDVQPGAGPDPARGAEQLVPELVRAHGGSWVAAGWAERPADSSEGRQREMRTCPTRGSTELRR